MKDPIKVAKGRSARALGADFELRVRKDLEEKGWVVSKWPNQVESNYCKCKKLSFALHTCYECGKKFEHGSLSHKADKHLVPAKHKFQQNGIPFSIGVGMPDFICLKQIKDLEGKFFRKILIDEIEDKEPLLYEVVGVECKTNGTLSKEEKEKCRWYLKNNIFSKIKIAEKTKVKGKIVIVYHDFEEKYGS